MSTDPGLPKTTTTLSSPLARARTAFGSAGLVEQVPLLVLIALCLFTAIATNRFLTPVNLTNVLLQASVMTVIAMGMTYVIVSGGFDLSVGSTTALAGCVAAATMLKFGVAAGVVAGVLAGTCVGLVNGLLISVVRLNPFIATLGTMVLVRGVVLLITQGRPISGEDGLPEAFLDYARTYVFGLPLFTWTPIVLFIVLWWILHRTAYGKRLFATGGNTEASFLAGIPVGRIRASAYVWAGALAGLAGVMLSSRLQSGQPTAGEFYELTAIAAVILGGATLYGGEARLHMTIVGVMIMVVLTNALNLLNVDSYWQRISIGIVILAAATLDQARRRKT